MGRIKLVIDKVELVRVISELENAHTYPNMGELLKAIEDTPWAKGLQPRPLTAQVAYLRIKELGIVCKTPKGKRGGTISEERIAKMQANRGVRVVRSEKLKKYIPSFEAMKQTFPANCMPIIERAQKGSIKAAITLKCLECSSYQRAEIRKCVISDCALFPVRPGA
jgi:hypothetical protein